MYYFLVFILCYISMDIFSGVYHLLTDRGWNFSRQVREFQGHHHRPQIFGIDWYPFIPAIPLLFAACLYESIELGILALCLAHVQLPHYFAHQTNNGPIVRFLQWTGFYISVENHAMHHDGVFNQNFCTVTSWNNWWFNKVIP